MFDFTHDGHVHTPFCPHGTKDPLEQYIQVGIEKGLQTITFTEHAPFPASFIDPVPNRDSAMPFDLLPDYLNTLQQMKQQYKGVISIKIGLEVDLLPNLEEETIALLEPYATLLDEVILSQHFLYVDGTYMPIDYSAETFDELVTALGSFENVMKAYYESIEQGLAFSWEDIRVARIGHLDLPIKYQKNYDWDRSEVIEEEERLLQAIADRGFGLDFNTAGLRKPDCGEPYVAGLAKIASRFHIPFTMGSDAHLAKDVGADFDMIAQKKATFL
ncbi:histidinol-phosphatase HisJ [Exiguobacterium marinum]|uniref:Histidinol-phosphatase n=1 Tax=Exiguobacterium marinum TaxID=273528 RepID=A0ABY7X5H9_9BACL|nr:histidinol-phosphatase HisJ [Exiguobacterium marinum]WDH77131.1 histidinol-phosphatase HisJ [Exiguobacterium marinum]